MQQALPGYPLHLSRDVEKNERPINHVLMNSEREATEPDDARVLLKFAEPIRLISIGIDGARQKNRRQVPAPQVAPMIKPAQIGAMCRCSSGCMTPLHPNS